MIANLSVPMSVIQRQQMRNFCFPHIHNHIIYNSTSLDATRKFKNFFLSGLAVQRLSDMVCLEHGLSIITPKPYREHQKRTVYPKLLRIA